MNYQFNKENKILSTFIDKVKEKYPQFKEPTTDENVIYDLKSEDNKCIVFLTANLTISRLSYVRRLCSKAYPDYKIVFTSINTIRTISNKEEAFTDYMNKATSSIKESKETSEIEESK